MTAPKRPDLHFFNPDFDLCSSSLREYDKKLTLVFCSVKLKYETFNLIWVLWGPDSHCRWHFKSFLTLCKGCIHD